MAMKVMLLGFEAITSTSENFIGPLQFLGFDGENVSIIGVALRVTVGLLLGSDVVVNVDIEVMVTCLF